MPTWSLRKGNMKRFVAPLKAEDRMAFESIGYSALFRTRIESHVALVAVIASSPFKVVRCSVNRSYKNDVRRIAFFLSKDMLPEAGHKSEVKTVIHRLIATRCKPVKHRVSLLNKAHSALVFRGIGIPKRNLANRACS